MAFFYPPPQPFLGGSQPLAGRELPPDVSAVPEDTPLASTGLRRAAALMAVVITAWQPLPQPLQARKLPPDVTAVPVDAAPGSGQQPTFAAIRVAWNADPPTPRPRLLLPLEITAGDPAPGSGQQPAFVTIRAAWNADPPVPRPRLPLPLEITAGDPAPGSGQGPTFATIRAAWEPGPPTPRPRLLLPLEITAADPAPGGRQPYLVFQDGVHYRPWKLVWPGRSFVGTPEATPDNPPFGLRQVQWSIRAAWEPGPPLPWQGRFFPQETVATADDPPFGLRQAQWPIRAAWEPGPPLPWQGRFFPQETIATADNPPFGLRRRLALADVVRAWEPSQGPLPQRANAVTRLVQGLSEPGPGTPEFMWVAVDPPLPQQRQRFVTQETVVTADDPPFGLRRLVPISPEQPWPQQRQRSVLEGPAAADDPPFGQRRQLPWPVADTSLPWRGYRLPQGEAVADNPPFGLRQSQWPIRTAWEPLFAWPWVARRVTAESVTPADNPPFGLRQLPHQLWEVASIWRPVNRGLLAEGLGLPGGTWAEPNRGIIWLEPLRDLTWQDQE